MKTITLISDWKLRDPYIAIFKGQLLNAIPDVNIIDITHSIAYHDITQTAFILQNSYSAFPNGSLHISLTGLTNQSDVMPIIVKQGTHTFIGTDNGVFSLLFNDDLPDEIRQFKANEPSTSLIDRILKMVIWHFKGEIDAHTNELLSLRPVFPVTPITNHDNTQLTGAIAYIDSFCNAVTNISVKQFKEFVQDKPFKATIDSMQRLCVTKYSDNLANFNDTIFLCANQFGYIEICMYNGHIAMLSNSEIGDKIIIEKQ
ncbi:MAG: SAM-dependent chlorinase/fluorinase [Bacteroidales bacterium]|nr:SAM-dependent chlorinase/fluorinase [Bacteroidales bacterium]